MSAPSSEVQGMPATISVLVSCSPHRHRNSRPILSSCRSERAYEAGSAEQSIMWRGRQQQRQRQRLQQWQQQPRRRGSLVLQKGRSRRCSIPSFTCRSTGRTRWRDESLNVREPMVAACSAPGAGMTRPPPPQCALSPHGQRCASPPTPHLAHADLDHTADVQLHACEW